MSSLLARRCFQQSYAYVRRISRGSTSPKCDSDFCGVPLRPTWSVNELLSSYPTPRISSETFGHLHKLSALVVPDEGTLEHSKLKGELEELIRLVEAVKFVDTQGIQPTVRGGDADADRSTSSALDESRNSGTALLNHSARTADGFYLVDADRKR